MKSNWVIVQKYAASLLEVVNTEKQIDQTVKELEEVVEMVESSLDLRTVVAHPLVKIEQKLACINSILIKMKISKISINFCKVLLSAERFELLPKILKEFIRISDGHIKRGKATVRSAKALGEIERSNLHERLQKQLDLKLEISWAEEKSLLGGFVVQTGNKVFDYSVEGQLERLEDKILKMRVR